MTNTRKNTAKSSLGYTENHRDKERATEINFSVALFLSLKTLCNLKKITLLQSNKFRLLRCGSVLVCISRRLLF